MAAKVKLFGRIVLAMLEPWASRKLWMTVIGLLVINSLYWTSVFYLYSFTEPFKAEIFYKMFSTAMWGTTAIVFSYLGIQALMSGWGNAAGVVTSTVQSVFKKEEKKTTTEPERTAKVPEDEP